MKKILIILLAIAGAYGCFEISGARENFSAMYTKVKDQDINIDGVAVHIQTNGTTSQEHLNILIDAIKTQPDYLKSKVQNLYLVKQEDLADRCQKASGGNFAVSASNKSDCSIANPSEMAVYIGSKHLEVIKANENSAKETVSHEMWHLYDFYYGKISQNEDFAALTNEYSEKITAYGANNTTEFFADAGADYILCPEKLKEESLEVFNYFESLPK